MPRYKPQTRRTIERIRESIDTDAAVKTLHEIGHNESNPISVRVKALQVLLGKTLPDLTAADITHNAEPVNPQELLAKLETVLGNDAYQALLASYQPAGMDS